jgi:hypothetical protein
LAGQQFAWDLPGGRVAGYAEAQLITNRVSVLLCGGTEADRKLWAQEAADAFSDEGALYEAAEPGKLSQSFSLRGGVVYVPDASQLSWAAQRELTRLLREREERPKFVFGINATPAAVAQRGLIREDLLFALSKSTVDLASPLVKESISSRRKKSKKGR